MFIKNSTNEHGVLVSHFNCHFCDRDFSLTPGFEDDEKKSLAAKAGCLSVHCISRNPEKYFDRITGDNGIVKDEFIGFVKCKDLDPLQEPEQVITEGIKDKIL